jgi:hypothetical protein
MRQRYRPTPVSKTLHGTQHILSNDLYLQLMNFEHDVMISYAWRDNQPPPMSKQEGWVSSLQEGLEFWLKQLMPRASRIWRDKNQMPGNKVFADELDEAVRKCAVLLTVLSEPYLSSEWCNRELQTFLKNAPLQGGLRVDNDYRVLKINKLPVERSAIPDELNLTTGFDFYEIDPETRLPMPIDPSFGDAERERFIKKVYSVAVVLAKLLRGIDENGLGKTTRPQAVPDPAISSQPEKPAAPPVPSQHDQDKAAAPGGLTVYLPHTTKDLRDIRDELVAELMRRNCTVLPQEQGHFDDVEEFRRAVTQDLAKSDVAIHIIGARYGIVLDGTTQSVTELQNDWAAAESRLRGLRRLIWLPKDMGEVAGTQAAFIERLRSDRSALEGADLMQDSAEVFKGQVHELLHAKPQAASAPPSAGLQIYLLHEESDKEAVRALRRQFKNLTIHSKQLHLSHQGNEVRLILPVFDGDASTTRALQRQHLMECDAVIIFWHGGSQAWVESSLNEIRKAPAQGRNKPFAAPHMVYLSGEKTTAKEDWCLDDQDGLLAADVKTVLGMDSAPAATLADYFQQLGL